jgi:hypothetical protein
MPGPGKPFPPLELTGQTFGRLTVLRPSERSRDKWGNTLWDCRCSCGTELMVRGKALTAGGSQSCGCLRLERSRGFQARRASTIERMADALDNLLAASERHIFSTECQKEREAARSALSAWKDGR